MTLFGWRLQAGDPTISGWVITGLYVVAAAACALNALALSGDRRRTVWGILALGMLLMGINKQLDLQTDFNAFGRSFLYSQGLYLLRQSVKNSLVIAMSLSGFFLLALAAWRTRHTWQQYWLALTGLLLLLSFVILRAGVLYGVPVVGATGALRGSWLLEPLGVFITGAAAWHNRRRFKNKPQAKS
jgi:hypothetical protein